MLVFISFFMTNLVYTNNKQIYNDDDDDDEHMDMKCPLLVSQRRILSSLTSHL